MRDLIYKAWYFALLALCTDNYISKLKFKRCYEMWFCEQDKMFYKTIDNALSKTNPHRIKEPMRFFYEEGGGEGISSEGADI